MKKSTFYILLLIISIWTIANFINQNWITIESANVLIAGLAFVGLMHSLNKQQQAINLQHEDLKMQRAEMELARSEMKEQNSTIKIQRFENTFFNMLQLQQEIVNQIDINFSYKKFPKQTNYHNPGNISDHELNAKSKDAFYVSYKILHYMMKERFQHVMDVPEKGYDIEEINKVYLRFYDELKTDLGHYFRNLYRIIKIVDKAKFDEDSIKDFLIKYEYCSILRAQLSDYELLLLFYNCISPNGNEFFLKYVEKYTIFKNIPYHELQHADYKKLLNPVAVEKPKNIASHIKKYACL